MDNTVIETERLLLRHPQPEDFGRLWDMLTDPAAKRYTGGVTRLNRGDREALFLKECEEDFSASGAEFAVVEKNSGKYIGYCGFRESENDGACEFLYGYCRDSWGRGYGCEAAAGALKYLFDNYPHDEYIATADAENVASVKILEKLGFKKLSLNFSAEAAETYVLKREDFKI